MRLILVLILSFNLVDAQNLSDVSFGGSNSLDVITWNIENFSKNGQQTIDSVAVIIQSIDADVIAAEIMNISDFNNLLSILPNYNGYCSSGSSRKMAFIYKSNLTVNSIYNIFLLRPIILLEELRLLFL